MAYMYKMHILKITGTVYCSIPCSYIAIITGSMMYLYVYVWTCFFYYLSNHVNHLFIIYQKIIQMAISFKINIVYTYCFVIPLIVYMELVLLF